MHPHADLVARFYDAFSERDGDAMVACYHPEVHFQDPAFDLRGARARAMWRMLCERGKDLQLVVTGIRADDHAGAAHWDADYTFGPARRPVHNRVDAAFAFEDGLIRTHRDAFDVWAWSRQALGVPGLLLGWTPWLRSKVAAEASKTLDAYIAAHPEAVR